jgi:hypothetical protein
MYARTLHIQRRDRRIVSRRVRVIRVSPDVVRVSTWRIDSRHDTVLKFSQHHLHVADVLHERYPSNILM